MFKTTNQYIYICHICLYMCVWWYYMILIVMYGTIYGTNIKYYSISLSWDIWGLTEINFGKSGKNICKWRFNYQTIMTTMVYGTEQEMGRLMI